MSMEAQFYEARRRQHVIERRQSLQTPRSMNQQVQEPEYHSLHIPVRVFRQNGKQLPCTCIPTRRVKLSASNQCLYSRDRDIYPRAAMTRRPARGPKLNKRFSSIEYLQQW